MCKKATSANVLYIETLGLQSHQKSSKYFDQHTYKLYFNKALKHMGNIDSTLNKYFLLGACCWKLLLKTLQVDKLTRNTKQIVDEQILCLNN